MKNYKWFMFFLMSYLVTILMFMFLNYSIIKDINELSYLYENEMWPEIISYLTD